MSDTHGSGGDSEPESKRLCTASASHERCDPAEGARAVVSVIMPVFNASDWLDECLQAILEQDFLDRMELSVYDDGSTSHVCVCVRITLESCWRDGGRGSRTEVVPC